MDRIMDNFSDIVYFAFQSFAENRFSYLIITKLYSFLFRPLPKTIIVAFVTLNTLHECR